MIPCFYTASTNFRKRVRGIALMGHLRPARLETSLVLSLKGWCPFMGSWGTICHQRKEARLVGSQLTETRRNLLSKNLWCVQTCRPKYTVV